MPRKKAAEAEEQDVEEQDVEDVEEDEERDEDEELEDEIEDAVDDVSISVSSDTVRIELPRDQDADKRLKAIANLIKDM